MTNNFLHDAGMIGSGVTFTSGMMIWLDEHASAIGILISLASLILTAVFFVLNYRLNLKRLDFDRRNIEDKRKQEEK